MECENNGVFMIDGKDYSSHLSYTGKTASLDGGNTDFLKFVKKVYEFAKQKSNLTEHDKRLIQVLEEYIQRSDCGG